MIAQIWEAALLDHDYSASDGDSESTVDPAPAMSAAAVLSSCIARPIGGDESGTVFVRVRG